MDCFNLTDDQISAYRQAAPFSHGVFPDLFPAELLRGAAAEIDEALTKPLDPKLWYIKDNANTGRKVGTAHVAQVGPNVVKTCEILASREFVDFLERLTGIKSIIADPTLFGGGVHAIGRGGFLNIHADFNFHSVLKKYRRVNVLLYLNENWASEYEGCLELWNRDMTECAVKIPPQFNHAAVFTSSDYSYHGHVIPLNCPEGVYRKSIASYYYTDELPANMAAEFHSTLYQTPGGK